MKQSISWMARLRIQAWNSLQGKWQFEVPKAEVPIPLLVVRKRSTLHLNFLVKVVENGALHLDEERKRKHLVTIPKEMSYKRWQVAVPAFPVKLGCDTGLKCSGRELCENPDRLPGFWDSWICYEAEQDLPHKQGWRVFQGSESSGRASRDSSATASVVLR